MRKASFIVAGMVAAALSYAAAGFLLAPRLIGESLVERAKESGAELGFQRIALDPFLLILRLDGIHLALPQEAAVVTAPRASIDLAWASLWSLRWTVTNVALAAPRLHVALAGGGLSDWTRLEAIGREPPPFVIERLTISDGTVSLVDPSRTRQPAAGIETLAVEIHGLSSVLDNPANYCLAARFKSSGTLTSTGHLWLRPFAAEGGIDATSLALPAMVRLVRPELHSMSGRLDFETGYSYDTRQERFVLRNASLEATGVEFMAGPARIELASLSVAAGRMAFPANGPVKVTVLAKMSPAGSVSATGNVALGPLTADVAVRVRDVPVALARFAGYRIKSGKLDAQLRYTVRESRLVGENDLILTRLQLGEKPETAGASDLPIELAVALLTDTKGRIKVEVPVSGDLEDPQFDLGDAFQRALGNVVRSVVNAPFRLLAALAGQPAEELNKVLFEPGSGELLPPEKETIAGIVRALDERPQLGVVIRGGYDPEVDESLPADRFAAKPQPLAGESAGLAAERAQAVRAALLDRGLPSERVQIGKPIPAEAHDDGVPTMLALTARNSSQ